MAGQYSLSRSSKSGDPRGKADFIRETAKKYGIDPETALKVAKSEGLATFLGDNGKSGGAFQLYTGGGLGNEFKRDTGLDPLDPKNEDATIEYAMKRASQMGWGPWYGAAKVGVGKWDGIGGGPAAAAADPADPTPNVGGGEESYRMPEVSDPTPNVGSGAGDYPPDQGALADAVAPPSKKYGDAAGDALADLGKIYANGPVAKNAARSSGSTTTPAATPLTPQGPFPMVDPKVAEAQRQQLAMALQRLNSGKLV